MRTIITYNGITSSDMGIVVEKYPNNDHAIRNVSTVRVAGRNGLLTVDNGYYDNYSQTYEFYVQHDSERSLQEIGMALADWLNADGLYHQFSETLEPDVYRMARLTKTLDITNIGNWFGRLKLTFDFQPQRWIASGQETESLSVGENTIVNPTIYESKPIFYVHLSDPDAAATLTIGINGQNFVVNDARDDMVIDSETMNAYLSDTLLNAATEGEFPTIPGGEQTIGITGTNISSVDIVPRWWRL